MLTFFQTNPRARLFLCDCLSVFWVGTTNWKPTRFLCFFASQTVVVSFSRCRNFVSTFAARLQYVEVGLYYWMLANMIEKKKVYFGNRAIFPSTDFALSVVNFKLTTACWTDNELCLQVHCFLLESAICYSVQIFSAFFIITEKKNVGADVKNFYYILFFFTAFRRNSFSCVAIGQEITVIALTRFFRNRNVSWRLNRFAELWNMFKLVFCFFDLKL